MQANHGKQGTQVMTGTETATPAELMQRLPKTEGGAGKLGGILITGVLGQGGMGVVYKGLHLRLAIPVAVKVLHAEQEPRSPMFIGEARMAAQVDHPNVVRIYDVNRDAALLFIVQEYVEGESVYDFWARHIVQGMAVPEARALDLCIDAARGLAAIHRTGIAHLDIKPTNLLIRRVDGLVKIADLGLAQRFKSGNLGRRVPEHIKNRDEYFGTPGYISPERLLGRGAGPAADIYALGITLYELLAGREAFRAETTTKLMRKQTLELPPELASLRQGLGPGTLALIRDCIAIDPAQRPQDAKALLERLLDARDALHPRQRPAAPKAETAPATVVCVDDEAEMREFLKDALEACGHTAHCFAGGGPALAFLATNPADVILLDMRLPGETGIEICRAIRTLQRNRATPIVFVSGEQHASSIDAARTEGATDYLTKPVNTVELLARVRCLTRIARINRERETLETQYRSLAFKHGLDPNGAAEHAEA